PHAGPTRPRKAPPAAAEAAPAAADPPPPPPPAPIPAKTPAAPAPAPISEAPPAPEPDAAAAAPPPAASPAESAGTHAVRRGETLSQIAAGVAGPKANSAHTQSWRLALYPANPRAFQSDHNVPPSRALLPLPDAP